MKILKNLQGFKPQSLLITTTLLGSFYVNAQNKFDEIYDSDVFIEEGVKLFDAGKYAESIVEYDKVAKTDIDYFKAQYEKAYSLFTLEKNEELEKMMKAMHQSGEIKKFPSLYIIYGNLLSKLNRFDESEKIYKEGAELIPNSNGLLFNTGIMYVRSEQNQKALEVFKNLVEVNPNNTSAHYILGILAFDDGQIVEGSLAMLGYLMIDPNGRHANDAIIQLNSKFGGVYKSNPQLSFSAQGDDFSELEMILKNELPLSDKYKLNSSIDDNYPRQLQAIMEYLPTHQSKGGFFETYYLPWLTEISKRNFTEAFTYYSLSSYQKQLGKALNSEKKKVEKFTTEYISKDFCSLYAYF